MYASRPVAPRPAPMPAARWQMLIWTGSALLIGVLAAAVILGLWNERRGTTRLTADAAQQSTQLLVVVVDQMIRDIDGVTAGLQLMLNQGPPAAGVVADETWAWIERRMAERAGVRSYWLLDRDGVIRRSSLPRLVGESRADRQYFIAHRDVTGVELARYVPDPYFSAVTGYRQLVVSWPLRTPADGLVGIFVVGFDTDVLERRLGQLVDTAHDIVALVKGDRSILAAAGVGGTQRLDPAHWDEGLAKLLAEHRGDLADSAIIQRATLFGNEAAWVVHVHDLELLEASIVLARNLDRVLAAWRGHVLAAMLGGSLLVLAIVAGAAALTGLLDRQSRALVAATTDALIDPLTSLFNRRMFDERAKIELSRAQREGHELVLMVLDIDHFKAVNDRLGHAAGDATLIAVGICLRSQLRREDLLARIGGEEFAILVPRLSTAAAVRQAERLRGAIEALATEVDGGAVRVTISIGIAKVGHGERAVATALAAADSALYTAKAAGRNRIAVAGGAPPATLLAARRRISA